MLGRKMICVEFINCLCINIANGIRLLDMMAIFVYTGKNFIQVRAFESNIPLKCLGSMENYFLVRAYCILFNTPS